MSGERTPRGTGWLTGASMLAGGVALLVATGRVWPTLWNRGGSGVARDDATAAIGRGRPQTPPSAEALHDGFEQHDTKPRTIGIVMLVSVAVIASCIGGLFALLHVLHGRDADAPPLTAQQRAIIQPPGPPLQSSPQYDLTALGKLQIDRLSRYAWTDQTRQRARIPLDRAMALAIGRSLDPTP